MRSVISGTPLFLDSSFTPLVSLMSLVLSVVLVNAYFLRGRESRGQCQWREQMHSSLSL